MNPTTISLFRSFRSPLSEAWIHLTRHELLARWLGQTELELLRDGEFRLETWNGDTATGRVIAVAAPVRLELAWRPGALSPESHVILRLEGDGPGSRLTVTHDGLKSEPERRAARQMWKEALAALRALLHDGTDGHEWGAGIPVTARAMVSRAAPEVWPLLSTGPGIEKWVAHVERFDGEAGGMFRLTSKFHGREIVEEGIIEELTPEARMVLSWEWIGEGWGAPTRVEFSVEAEPQGASVLIVHSGFDRIASEQRLAARKNYVAAWPEVLGDLKRLVSPAAA
ncbi:MAG TPA: SRPBCC domain-containing protein [Candidatus Eisenbacteria bacterium]|nr:SRPBCC domain-containing protein [Candidatus Eisenbacteria bacterium]